MAKAVASAVGVAVADPPYNGMTPESVQASDFSHSVNTSDGTAS